MMVEHAVADGFPVGLRVLVVCDDSLRPTMEDALVRECQYKVEMTDEEMVAVEMLKENKFDIVISDVQRSDMDGFKLLQHVGHEFAPPVVMLSEKDDCKLTMEWIRHGAADCLLKPVRIQDLKNIWQHVVRKNRLLDRRMLAKEGGRKGQVLSTIAVGQDVEHHLSRKRKCLINGEIKEDEDADTTKKKQRFVWTPEMHEKFVSVVNKLGIDKAFPKKILSLMNVEGLTRENVASHLQKYRISLKKRKDESSQLSSVTPLTESSFYQRSLSSNPNSASPSLIFDSSSHHSTQPAVGCFSATQNDVDPSFLDRRRNIPLQQQHQIQIIQQNNKLGGMIGGFGSSTCDPLLNYHRWVDNGSWSTLQLQSCINPVNNNNNNKSIDHHIAVNVLDRGVGVSSLQDCWKNMQQLRDDDSNSSVHVQNNFMPFNHQLPKWQDQQQGLSPNSNGIFYSSTTSSQFAAPAVADVSFVQNDVAGPNSSLLFPNEVQSTDISDLEYYLNLTCILKGFHS
ncbi:hypothetical protein Dimus_034269 [Dionaea muscipula]